jgi:redox-sensitive bicupin YhaK (pirin superfamily)
MSAANLPTAVAQPPRAISYRTQGHTHGPITRLMSPGDFGKILKPFVFLDFVDVQPASRLEGFGMHPHSGIATLTFLIEGGTSYEDTTGKQGVLPAGGVEWMSAGNGVWHTGAPVGDSPISGFQLWVALPASHENSPAQSHTSRLRRCRGTVLRACCSGAMATLNRPSQRRRP